MTKKTITSILENISEIYQADTTGTITEFHINDTGHCLAVRIKVGTIYCGTIYCNSIRIDDSEFIEFINDEKIISIFNYLAIEEIDLL